MNAPEHESGTIPVRISPQGTEQLYRHAFNLKLVYSQGVHDLVNAGWYWPLDSLAIDLARGRLPRASRGQDCRFRMDVHVTDGVGVIKIAKDDELPLVWKRQARDIDMPDGHWAFALRDNGENVFMTLAL